MAADAQVPVVPVGLVGTALVWPRGEPMPRTRPSGGVLEVRFGGIIGPPTMAAAARRRFTAAVQEAVAELSEQPTANTFAEVRSDPSRGS
jgi:1-acyl-sn-glycerol-3-phosphate acyltransferase